MKSNNLKTLNSLALKSSGLITVKSETDTSLTSLTSVTSVNYVTSVARVCNVFLCFGFSSIVCRTLGGARGEAADRPRRSEYPSIPPIMTHPSRTPRRAVVRHLPPTGKNYSGSGWPARLHQRYIAVYNNQVWFLHDTDGSGSMRAGRGSRAP